MTRERQHRIFLSGIISASATIVEIALLRELLTRVIRSPSRSHRSRSRIGSRQDGSRKSVHQRRSLTPPPFLRPRIPLHHFPQLISPSLFRTLLLTLFLSLTPNYFMPLSPPSPSITVFSPSHPPVIGPLPLVFFFPFRSHSVASLVTPISINFTSYI